MNFWKWTRCIACYTCIFFKLYIILFSWSHIFQCNRNLFFAEVKEKPLFQFFLDFILMQFSGPEVLLNKILQASIQFSWNKLNLIKAEDVKAWRWTFSFISDSLNQIFTTMDILENVIIMYFQKSFLYETDNRQSIILWKIMIKMQTFA